MGGWVGGVGGWGAWDGVGDGNVGDGIGRLLTWIEKGFPHGVWLVRIWTRRGGGKMSSRWRMVRWALGKEHGEEDVTGFSCYDRRWPGWSER